MAKDAIGRQHQVATIQFDFNMPERFDLFCINEQGEQERIVMVHAAIMGSIERFLSVYIEHCAGNFPVWLAPVQAVVLPISDDKHGKFAQEAVIDKLRELIPGIRIELDNRSESVGKRIREAATQKIPYLLVVGDKEMDKLEVAVRGRGDQDLGVQSIEAFANLLKEEIQNKK
jgi:threonyl-tRNA synthetase